jgi:calcineurin-like phosphoesterase family protein
MTVMGTPHQRPPHPTARAMVAVPELLPYRPKSTSSKELGFRRRKPVHWLQPLMLVGTAVQVVLSNVFGEFLDKRELETTLPPTVFREGDVDSPEADLWFDYVADLGDGFNATYTMAYLIAQPQLTVDGQQLPRGHFLVMGGDEVYPTPSSSVYTDKTAGPYRAALPAQPPTGLVPLYALPGNHDWYDGLSSFMRLFIKHGEDTLGGWCNTQSRSYFAIQLPHRWWLFAIDTQFGNYLDQPQIKYFTDAMGQLRDGDKVILCTPTPGWVEGADDPGAYNTIDYFVRTVIDQSAKDIKIKLMLSGDLHHYARYQAEGGDATTEGGVTAGRGVTPQLIHCGGGGAYLYPTHEMPRRIEVPPKPDNPHLVKAQPSQKYRLAKTFPSRGRSIADAIGVLWRAPLRNWGFIVLLGLMQTLFTLSLLGKVGHASELTNKWIWLPIIFVGLLMVGGSVYFALLPTDGTKNRPLRLFLGLLHGAAQIALGIWGTHRLHGMSPLHAAWPRPIGLIIAYMLVMGVVSALVFCVYLLIAGTFGINVNELFSAQAIIDSKSFLRLHIDRTGKLTIYVIGVPRVSRRWKANPDGEPWASWLDPRSPIKTKLADDRIEIF